MRQTTVRALTAAIALAAFPAAAAELPQLTPGGRVRLTLAGGTGRLLGTLVAADDSNLTVVREDGALVIPRNRIARLEVRSGHRRRPFKGALLGALGGAALFAFGSTCELASPGERCPSRAKAMGLGAWSFGLLGFGIGALVKSDRWVELPSSAELVSPPVARHGLAVSFSVRF